MVNLQTFLKNVEAIAAEKPSYKLGHDGSDGFCDCIGMIIGAIRRSGETWNGTHGSNYAARNEMVSLNRITGSSELKIGDIVYKARNPGDPGYSLPDRYSSSPDQRDYYHVGVVTGQYPLRITHCTAPTIKEDSSLGKWTWYGKLKKVNYTYTPEEEKPMYSKATITAPTGNTVNLRAEMATTSKLIDRIPVKSTVEIIRDLGEWCYISWNGKKGYVISNYLNYTDVPEDTQNPEEEQDQLREQMENSLKALETTRDRLDEIRDWIDTQVEAISAIVGRG